MANTFPHRTVYSFLVLCVLIGSGISRAAASNPFLRDNLAGKAQASASDALNHEYTAKFAIDGKIPISGHHNDQNKAWSVNGKKNKQTASLQLKWETPVTITELLYYGRTAYQLQECFKDYEVYIDDRKQPVARGTFEMKDGPQRISFPPVQARTVTLKFLSSYGGDNPGASEIKVFAQSISDDELRRNERLAEAYDRLTAYDCRSVQTAIDAMASNKGTIYTQCEADTAELQRLQTQRQAILAEIDAGNLDNGDLVIETVEALDRLKTRVVLCDVKQILLIERHEILASHVYTYHYEGFRAGGGIYILILHEPHAQPQKIVDAGEGQILDATLSYDGEVILFSWRKRESEGYHLFTVRVDGTELTQLTEGPWHDYNGCWLPDGGIAFISTRSARFAYCWHAPVGLLHRMNGDGTGVVRLSANIVNDFTPAILHDGRILYTRWEYVDKPAIPIQSLWSINPDGSGLAGYYGNRVLTPGTFMDAKPIPGSDKIICTMTGHNGPTRGAIGIIDRTKGVNAQEAIQNLTPDVHLGPVNQGNGNMDMGQWGAPVNQPYCNPYPLDDSRYLVSSFGKILARDMNGMIEALVAETGEEMWYYNPLPIAPRPVPPVIASTLPPHAESEAVVVLQNVYNGLEPYVKRGEVKEIRVVLEMEKTVRIDPSKAAFGFQFPVISCGATYAAKRVLGSVPVAEDGSACFQVPAGVPLYFMAIDREGRAVQRMRTFTHFMPGEIQGCIGCHEHRNETSRTISASQQARTPQALIPPEWGTDGFDYSTFVQPILDRHCVKCHHPQQPPNGIDLTGGKTDYFNVSYEILARENQGPSGSPYVNWIPTYNGQEQNILEITPKAWGSPQSPLAEVILSGHPAPDGQPRIQLQEWEKRRILAWIDLNVPYYGTPETAYPDNVGCRRLYPGELESRLAEISQRRCASCHTQGIPRREWVRITEPELNDFLMAPLAREAGGRETCGQAVFKSTSDRDYRAILQAFEPIRVALKTTPRMDMPGAVPCSTINRSCK